MGLCPMRCSEKEASLSMTDNSMEKTLEFVNQERKFTGLPTGKDSQ